MLKKRSFFERLVGSVRLNDDDDEEETKIPTPFKKQMSSKEKNSLKNELDIEHEEEEGQLTVDLYQTPTEIIIQTMISGVQPDNLSVTISRDMIIIKGKREENRSINEESYFVKELFWGSFSRTISLPEEVDPEEATAVEKHGLLTIRLPKINKEKQTNLKVKSV